MSWRRAILQAVLLILLLLMSGYVFGVGFSLSAHAAAASRPSPVAQSALVPITLLEPSGAPHIGETPQGLARTGEPTPRSGGAPSPAVAASPTPRPVPSPRTTAGTTKPAPSAHRLSGTASWGFGWAGTVTRLPRGTWITVRGPLGVWSGRSVGYGPAVWTGRVADLSRAVFAAICGDPILLGLCSVTVSW